MFRSAAPALAALLLVAGCGSAAPEATSSRTPSPPGTPRVPSPAEALATAARAAADARYTATYTLVSTPPSGGPAPSAAATATAPTTVTVAIGDGGYRIALTSGGSTSVLLHTGAGTVSCQVTGAKRACFRVAGPGEPVPALFDPGIQGLFTGDLPQLAAHATAYHVSRVAAPSPPPQGVDMPECFAVQPRPDTPAPRVTGGTYCLADGRVAAVSYPSGTLSLVRLSPAPGPSDLRPPASPVPLPSTSG